jgi:hypothetical protein
MAKCTNCGRIIAFGGPKDGEQRFCGEPCRRAFRLGQASSQLPHEFVLAKAAELHAGPCPKCGGAGPVDVHTSFSVWSAVVITRWSEKPEICCKPCGNAARWKATALSGLLGWWGFPWGLLITPAQIIRNLGSMISGPDPRRPSDKLVGIVQTGLSNQLLHEQERARVEIAANAVRKAC